MNLFRGIAPFPRHILKEIYVHCIGVRQPWQFTAVTLDGMIVLVVVGFKFIIVTYVVL